MMVYMGKYAPVYAIRISARNFKKRTMYLIFLILCDKIKINNFEKCIKY